MFPKSFPSQANRKKILREINSAINSVDINAFAKNSMICGVGGTARATLKLINSIYDFESSNRSFFIGSA